MKYIAMTILVLLALAGFSLGMFALFDSSVVISESPPEPSIEFVELSNDKSCNREMSKKIGKLMSQKHTCQSHSDCELKLYSGGCGSFIINNENALLVDELHEQKSTCINHMITSCMMVYDTYQYEAMCIDNYCKKAKIIDPETEIKKYLETGIMFK